MTQSISVSRHAFEGADVMRAYGRALPRVIHVSLGTNDDPTQVDAFRAAIRDVMDVAGPHRCVVWTNIVRPPVAGASYAGYNRALALESRPARICGWSTGPAWSTRIRLALGGRRARERRRLPGPGEGDRRIRARRCR